MGDGLAEWRAQRVARGGAIPVRLPTILRDRLDAFGVQLWSAALELAQSCVDAELDGSSALTGPVQAERTESARLAGGLGLELDQAKAVQPKAAEGELTSLAEVERLRQELAESRLKAAALQARVSEIERRANDLDQQLLRLSQLNSELAAGLAAAARPPAPRWSGGQG